MSSKVFVGGLSWSTNNDSLKQAFEEFGEVTDAIVMTDRDTGRSRGFGFVTFSKEEDAAAIVDKEMVLDGRRIKVNLATARPGRA